MTFNFNVLFNTSLRVVSYLVGFTLNHDRINRVNRVIYRYRVCVAEWIACLTGDRKVGVRFRLATLLQHSTQQQQRGVVVTTCGSEPADPGPIPSSRTPRCFPLGQGIYAATASPAQTGVLPANAAAWTARNGCA